MMCGPAVACDKTLADLLPLPMLAVSDAKKLDSKIAHHMSVLKRKTVCVHLQQWRKRKQGIRFNCVTASPLYPIVCEV